MFKDEMEKRKEMENIIDKLNNETKELKIMIGENKNIQMII